MVDRKLVLAQEQDSDRGATWLETNSAGSGPFRLLSWQANEAVVLAANPHYRHGAPGVQRVILRHVPEPSAQRLLLERGDVDLARDLTPDLTAGLAGNAEIAVDSHPRGTVIYLAANAGHPILGNECRHCATRSTTTAWRTPSSPASSSCIRRSGRAACGRPTPRRRTGSTSRGPVAAGAGGPRRRVRGAPRHAHQRAVPRHRARFGRRSPRPASKPSWRPGRARALWPRYRAREHELILAPWSPDYVDPHSNADAFARNPDNRRDANLTDVLAWRNGWTRDEFNAAAVQARNELDPERRAQLYRDLQRRLQHEGPYVIMFQQTEQVARRRNVAGFATGPAFDQTWYRTVTKRPAAAR